MADQDRKNQKTDKSNPAEDNGEAWKINSSPKDKPDWLGEGVHSRSGDDYEGEAWQINEPTKGDDHDNEDDQGEENDQDEAASR